jgi:hypothetical protein
MDPLQGKHHSLDDSGCKGRWDSVADQPSPELFYLWRFQPLGLDVSQILSMAVPLAHGFLTFG